MACRIQRPTVGLNFHHVFARIRTRLAHDDDQGFVYGRALAFTLTRTLTKALTLTLSQGERGFRRKRGFRIQNVAQIQAVTFQLLQGLPVAGTNDVSGHFNGLRAADPNDADSPLPDGSGDRTNSILKLIHSLVVATPWLFPFFFLEGSPLSDLVEESLPVGAGWLTVGAFKKNRSVTTCCRIVNTLLVSQ